MLNKSVSTIPGNTTIKINSTVPDRHKKLVQLRLENIVHYIYQLKRQTGCKVLIRDLLYFVPVNEIIERSMAQGTTSVSYTHLTVVGYCINYVQYIQFQA